MNRTKKLQGPCAHCGGSIEYPVDLIGTTTRCPHCGQSTELVLAKPPQEPAVPRRLIIWSIIAAIIIALGAGATIYGLKRAQTLSERIKAKHSQTPPQK